MFSFLAQVPVIDFNFCMCSVIIFVSMKLWNWVFASAVIRSLLKIKCISENSNIIIIQRLHVWAIMQTLSYCQSVKTFPRIAGTLELIRLLIFSFECHLARVPPPAQTHARSPPPLYIQVTLSRSCPAERCSAMNSVAPLITEYKLIYVQFCKLYILL